MGVSFTLAITHSGRVGPANEPEKLVPDAVGTPALIPAFSPGEKEDCPQVHHNTNLALAVHGQGNLRLTHDNNCRTPQ